MTVAGGIGRSDTPGVSPRSSRSLQRLAIEVDGWLQLGCAEKALERLQPLTETPGTRELGMALKTRALIELRRHDDALRCVRTLRRMGHGDVEWLEVTEAWCRKRLDDLPGAIQCIRRLLDHREASAIGHFNLGCYLALAGDPDAAITAVQKACAIDPDFAQLAQDEPDLDGIRRLPGFPRPAALRHGSEGA